MASNPFRTELQIEKQDFEVSHDHRLVTLGSCFSDNIGGRLKNLKFNITVNPFGTLFNPLSIAKLLSNAPLKEGHIVDVDGVFYHMDLHSSIRSLSKEALLQEIDQRREATKELLSASDYLFITLGTAYVYEYCETEEVVANCQKIPQRNFRKRLLSVEEITEAICEVKAYFPSLEKIILTVSPVRHIKDTLPLNSVSKSTLRLACHRLSEKEGFIYFPAYELLIDDLRDYRFFASDMIHPSDEAVNYIWQKFQETFFNTSTIQLNDKISAVLSAVAHRPFNPDSAAHQKFLQKTLAQIEQLAIGLDFEEEIESLHAQITK